MPTDHEKVMAMVAADIARLMAPEEPVQLPVRRRRRATGPSIVYSIRLDPVEVAELEKQAAAADMKPTALARNLVRIGLASRNGENLTRAVDRLEAAMQELRSVVP
jgi:hypothetical protein